MTQKDVCFHYFMLTTKKLVNKGGCGVQKPPYSNVNHNRMNYCPHLVQPVFLTLYSLLFTLLAWTAAAQKERVPFPVWGSCSLGVLIYLQLHSFCLEILTSQYIKLMLDSNRSLTRLFSPDALPSSHPCSIYYSIFHSTPGGELLSAKGGKSMF